MVTKNKKNDRNTSFKLVLHPRFEIFQKNAILAVLGRIGHFRAGSNLSGIMRVNWWFMAEIYFFISQNLRKSPDNLYFLSKYQEKWAGHDFWPKIGLFMTGSNPSCTNGAELMMYDKNIFFHSHKSWKNLKQSLF